MPKMPRNYKREYAKYHGKPEQVKNRAARNKARADYGLEKGDSREVDHRRALSKGGSPVLSNTRITTRTANRRKYNK